MIWSSIFKGQTWSLDIPENTDPGPGEVEEEYCDELAEEKEIKDSVLGAEGLDEDEELDGGEGKLGEDLEDDHLVAPAEWVSTQVPLLQEEVGGFWWEGKPYVCPEELVWIFTEGMGVGESCNNKLAIFRFKIG